MQRFPASFIALLIVPLFISCTPSPPPLTSSMNALIGSTAPDFTLRDAHGGDVTLSKITSQNHPVLLIYYLGYSCPHCVTNLQNITNMKSDFDKLHAQIIAISPDTIANTKDSISSFADFPFPLLSDPDMKVARAYGLFDREKLQHATLVIDTQRTVQFADKGEHPFDAPNTLLDTLKKMQSK